MYNFTASRIGSEVQRALAQMVTDAKKTAPENEHSLIELAGQAAHVVLQEIDEDSLVEMQVHGSDTPSAGARTFFISITARAIKEKATTAPEVKPWTPDQGPLALRNGA